MSESAALIKYSSIVDCASREILYTQADSKVKKAFKDEFYRECKEVIIDGLAQ